MVSSPQKLRAGSKALTALGLDTAVAAVWLVALDIPHHHRDSLSRVDSQLLGPERGRQLTILVRQTLFPPLVPSWTPSYSPFLQGMAHCLDNEILGSKVLRQRSAVIQPAGSRDSCTNLKYMAVLTNRIACDPVLPPPGGPAGRARLGHLIQM
jgi:hypothetical protein